jgi:membrane-associated HD superfamily phosphohydrolase
LHPQFFVENQGENGNPHDQLEPSESVRVIKEHVEEGIRLGRSARLPPAIVDVIPQHHGTRLLTYFYEKAKKMAGADAAQVREADYRYAGPKPQTKEAAVIMLADAVEAAARTLPTHSQENLLELIRRLVSAVTEDGQLAECDITLAELDRITFGFLETLSSIYHSRVTYPGFDFRQVADAPASKPAPVPR